MPGLMSTTTALTLYNIDNINAITAEKLQQYAFTSIDDLSTEIRGWGWTNLDDMFDTHWHTSVPEKGAFMAFSLRMDTRKVPAAVLKKHLAEAFKEEEAKAQAEGRTVVSRARKKELKELYIQKLMSKAEPVPSAVDVVLDTTSGLVYVGSVSASVRDLVAAHMATSFGVNLTPLPLAGLEDQDDLADQGSLEALMATVYAASQSVNYDGHGYTVAEAGQATLVQDDGAEVSVKNAPESTKASLDAGLHIQKLKLHIERNDDDSMVWNCLLHKDFSLSGLKTPHVERAHDDDPDAAFLEKMYLIQQAVGVLHALFQQHFSK